MLLQVKFAKKGTTLIANIIGEIDHHSSEYVRQKIDGEILKSTSKNIILDFSRVSFMDSSGIGIIMGRYKKVQQLGGILSIVNTNARISQMLEMAGVLRIVPSYSNLDEAIRSCS